MHRVVLNVFILWHVCGIGLWLSPDSRFRDWLLTPFRPYISFFGFWQRWSVFAPDPKKWSTYLTAVITFRDGAIRNWEFPRMEKLNPLEQMFKERYRKWAIDCVNDPAVSFIWPDTARYIARLYNNDRNPPVSVSLVRHWEMIPRPDGLPHNISYAPEGALILHTEKINPEDLK